MSDVCYWLTYPLDSEDVAVLRRAAENRLTFGSQRERFLVAYLIARKCLRANYRKRTLTVTPKGQDALTFYRPREVIA